MSPAVGVIASRCHAGFMRILSPAYVRAFAGRALNVHPSLRPAVPGLHVQRQALEHGATVAGATVHFVDEGVDTDPEAIRLFAEGRLRIEGRRVMVLPEEHR